MNSRHKHCLSQDNSLAEDSFDGNLNRNTSNSFSLVPQVGFDHLTLEDGHILYSDLSGRFEDYLNLRIFT